MATVTIDTIKMRLVQDKEGHALLLRLNPADELGVAALALAPIGSRFKTTFSDLDEEGNPTTEKEAQTQTPTTHATASTVTEKAAGAASGEPAPASHDKLPTWRDMRGILNPAPVSRRLSNEAGKCCGDARFQAFLREKCPDKWRMLNLGKSEERATLIVYDLCDVKSRKEFILGKPAGDRWIDLYGKYLAWRDAPEQTA